MKATCTSGAHADELGSSSIPEIDRTRRCRGIAPNLPARKSSNAFLVSASLLITKEPPITTGSPIGGPL